MSDVVLMRSTAVFAVQRIKHLSSFKAGTSAVFSNEGVVRPPSEFHPNTRVFYRWSYVTSINKSGARNS